MLVGVRSSTTRSALAIVVASTPIHMRPRSVTTSVRIIVKAKLERSA